MDIQTLLDQDFNNKTKASIFNCINIATKAFAQFKIENREFFNYPPKLKTLNGYLLTYAVERQLYNSSLTPTSDFSIITKDVNEYKYQATFLRTDNFICNIGRTKEGYSLLPKSKYRQEYAKINSDVTGKQLILEPLRDTVTLEPKLSYYYAQISYLYLSEYDKLTHLDIVVPNKDYSSSLYHVNLLGNTKSYAEYINPQLEEEEIVTLKNTLKSEIKNLAQ